MTAVKQKEKAAGETQKLKKYQDSRSVQSLDDLSKTQRVDPWFDVTTIFGTWPGEPDDGFEEIIHKKRQCDISLRISDE